MGGIVLKTLRNMHIVLHSLSASCRFTVRILAEYLPLLESLLESQAAGKAAEPPPAQQTPSSILSFLRCVISLVLPDVLLVGSQRQ